MHLLCLLTLALTAAPEASAVGLDEEVHSGRLVALSGESLRLADESGAEQTFSVNDLRSLKFPAVEPPSTFADPPAVMIVLTDGTQLAATDCQSQTDSFRITTEDLGEIKLPLSALRAVRCGDPDKVAARWEELLQRENASDLLVRRKQDVLDFVEGSVGDISTQAISFLLPQQKFDIPRDRVFGVIYALRSGDRARPQAEVRIGRSRLQARDVALDGDACRVTLAATDTTVNIPLDRIHLIEFAGRVRFLGDLEPALTLPTGIAEEERLRYFRRGSEPFGGPLRIGSDEVIAKEGLWIHSGVTARYRINRDFRRLVANVGMDHNVGGNRAVKLVVTGDGRTLFDETITYAQPARQIDLDVSDVRDLEIKVERLPESLKTNIFAMQEHLDLGQIRLVR